MDSSQPVRDLCARVFQEPQRLVGVYASRLHAPLHLPVHRHANLLQLDVVGGCTGRWLGKNERTLSGISASVFYPRETHGYDFLPREHGAFLFSVKLRVEPQWLALKRRSFPGFVSDVTGEAPLLKALWRLGRLSELHTESPLLPSALAEVFALWPRPAQGSRSTGANAAFVEPTSDPLVAQALKLIDAFRSQPLSVAALAREIHLSPRQLCRRMRVQLGCSPQQCIVARRVGRARELLATGSVSITEAAEVLGFASIHTFSRWFRRATGTAPSAWRERPPL